MPSIDNPQTQYVEIPIDGGIDTRTAPERCSPQKMLVHEDGSFREPGAVNVRRAYSARVLSGRYADSEVQLTGLRALFSDGDAMLGIGAGNGLDAGKAWAWEPNEEEWVMSDAAAAFPVTRRRDVYQQSDVDVVQMARVTGWVMLYMRVYGGNAHEHRYCLVNESDWTVRRDGWLDITVSGTISTPAACQPRLVAIDDRYFALVFVDTTDLSAIVFDTDSPHLDWGNEQTLATTHATDLAIDAWYRPADSSAYIVYNTATPSIGVIRMTIVAGAPTAAASATFGSDHGSRGIAIAGDDSASGAHSRLVIAYCHNVNGLKARTIARPGLTNVATGTIDATQTSVRDIGILTYSASTDVATIAYYDAASDFEGSYTRFMRYNAATGAVAGTPATEQVRGVYLYAKPRRVRGFDLFPCGRHQQLENTLYLFANARWRVDSAMTAEELGTITPVACMLPFTADGRVDRNNNIAAMIASADSDKLLIAAYEPQEVQSSLRARGVMAIFEVDFSVDAAHRHCVVEGQLMMAGSLPRVWERDQLSDGNIETPRGFTGFVPLHSPVIDSLTESAATGSLSEGIYRYKFTFEYQRRNGRVSRGIPSPPYEVTLGAGENRVTIALNGTKYQGPSAGYGRSGTHKLVVWRTVVDADPLIYYRLVSLSPGDTTWTDDLSDSNLEDNEVLYTDQGELANEPAPPCLALFAWKGRPVALHAETRELWLGKSLIPGDLQGFSGELALETTVWKSPAIYASPHGDTIIVWWPDAIGVVYGEPGSDSSSGAPATLQRPSVIWKGVGLSELASVVETPNGIFFRHENRIYQLDAGLGLKFVGQDAERYLSSADTIVAAVYLRDEVRFVTSTAKLLVYHLLEEKWHCHLIGSHEDEGNKPTIASACVHDGALNLCWEAEFDTDTGFAWYEDDGATEDPHDATPRPVLRQRTAWLSLAGILTQERVRILWLLGTFPEDATLTFEYDFSESAVETKSAFGTGVANQIVEMRLPRQDCHAVRITIAGHTRLVAGRVEIEVEKGAHRRSVTRA